MDKRLLGIVLLLLALASVVIIEEYRIGQVKEEEALVENGRNELKNTVLEKDLEIVEKNRELSSLLENNSILSRKLLEQEAKIGELENNKTHLEEELKKNYATVEELKEDYNALYENFTNFELRANDSMSWFRNNSRLGEQEPVRIAEYWCVREDAFNYPCEVFYLKKYYSWGYAEDLYGDRLFSLEEILERKGGDCEDWSLFAKALLNRMKEGYGGENAFWLMEKEGGKRFELFEEGNGTLWYYPDMKKKEFGKLKDWQFLVVCHDSHCVNAFTNSSIEITPENLEFIHVFEPQNGEYVGEGKDFGVCSESACDKNKNIWLFITDEDMYVFEDSWESYGLYSKYAEERKKGILEMLNRAV